MAEEYSVVIRTTPSSSAHPLKAPGLFLRLGHREYSCSEHRGADTFMNKCFQIWGGRSLEDGFPGQ